MHICIEELSAGTVADAVRTLEVAEESAVIDVRRLRVGGDGPSRGAGSMWALALSNILLRIRPDIALRVELPDPRDTKALAFLARTGLLFAFAQRDGVPEECWKGLGTERARWRTDWRHNATDQRRRLFFPDDAAPETQEGLDLASFVNPHRERTPNLEVEVGKSNVRPWIFSRLQDQRGRTTVEQEQLANEIGAASLELVQNIPWWAGLTRSGHSLVQVHMTRGERTNVYLTALDTGQGIIASLRGRSPQLFTDAGKAWSAEEAIHAILRRDVEVQHGRARGRGLQRVFELVSQYQGNLHILTAPAEDSSPQEAGLLQVSRSWQDGPSEGTDVRHPGIPFRGTLVRASFHLRSATTRRPDGQQRILVDTGTR